MDLLIALALLIGVALAIALTIAWIVLPFTISRLLRSIDERLYHVNVHLVEIKRLQTERAQLQPPPPLPSNPLLEGIRLHDAD